MLTVIASSLAAQIQTERDKWLQGLRLGGLRPNFEDMELSGDLPGGLEGSGVQPPVGDIKPEFDIMDILDIVAVDNISDAVSFMPSSSYSESSRSIIEASVSEYDGIDSEEDMKDKESAGGKYDGDNELGMGGVDHEKEENDIFNDLDPNAIPDAFQNGAFAETGPETDVAINQVSTRAKANPDESTVPLQNDVAKGNKASISGRGKEPPNVLKYTAVIGVVMVAGAVGMGALLSAIGVGAVRLCKRVRRGKAEEA